MNYCILPYYLAEQIGWYIMYQKVAYDILYIHVSTGGVVISWGLPSSTEVADISIDCWKHV